ncbi:MAG: hypothetical protein AAGA90_07985 [Actinomycetota bacterium]
MAVAVVQSKPNLTNSSVTSLDVTLDATPTEGNTLLLFYGAADLDLSEMTDPAGWTLLGSDRGGSASQGGAIKAYYKVAGASEPATIAVAATSAERLWLAVVELSGADTPTLLDTDNNTSGDTITLTGSPASGSAVLEAATSRQSNAVTAIAGYTEILDEQQSNLSGWLAYELDPASVEDIVFAGANRTAGLAIEIPEAAPSTQTIVGVGVVPTVTIGAGELVEFEPGQTIVGVGVVPTVTIGAGTLLELPDEASPPAEVQGTSTPLHGSTRRLRHRVLYGPIGGQPINELRVDSVTYVEVLNAPGAVEVVIPFAQPTLADGTPIVTRENLAPKRTAIWVLRDDALRAASMLWGMPRNFVDRTRTLTTKGWLSYFRHRFYETDQSLVGVDQLAIARAIIDHAQAVTGGDVGVDTSESTLSGVTRDRTYLAREAKNYGDALEQLAAVQNGFDFRFEPSINPVTGEFQVSLRTEYPAGGRETDHVFHDGVNCVFVDGDEDGENGANSSTATGAGEGVDLLSTTVADLDLLGVEPLLQFVAAYTDVVDATTLTEHANRNLVRRSSNELTITATMIPGTDPVPGSYRTGDLVRAVYTDPFESIDRTMRIVAIVTDESRISGETITVELGPTDPLIAPDAAAAARETERRLALLERSRRATP